MALRNIVGVDHAVVLVRDLAQAAEGWRRLGFTVSPRGTHSPQMGTGNHTIMLGEDYIELIAVLAETPQNEASRALLARRGEGLERIAFTALDAAAGVEELRARGVAALGPVDFGRPVTLPGGGETEARFKVLLWPEEAPAGLRIFACQHLTRDAVWLPGLQRHANTARRLLRIEVLSAAPRADAAHLARLIDGAAEAEPDGAMRVESGGNRAAFVFLSRATLEARHPGVPLDGLPQLGGAALVLAAEDPAAAAEAIGPAAVRGGASVAVPPAAANGVLVAFEKG